MFSLENYYFNPHALPVFFVGILTFFIGLFVILQKSKSSINVSFFFLCFSASLWLVATAIGYCSINGQIAALWFKIDNFGVLFISVNVYCFTRSFLNLRYGLFTYLGYIQALIFGLIVLNTHWLVTGAEKFYWGYFPKWGLFSIPVFLIFFGYMVASFYMLIKYFLKGDLLPAKRNQTKYLLVGYIGGYVGAVDFLPALGVSIYPFGYFPYLLFLSVVAYAVVKYRLLDITLAITRTGLLLVVYGAIFIIPIMVVYIYKEPIYNFIGNHWGLSLFLVGCYSILASLAPLFYSYLQEKAEHRLLKEQRRYQEILRKAARGMTREKDLKRLLNLIAHTITKVVKLDYAAIYLFRKADNSFILEIQRGIKKINRHTLRKGNNLIRHLLDTKQPLLYEEMKARIGEKINSNTQEIESYMKDLNAKLIIPSFLEEDLLGFIVLGNKISGTPYSQDDITVFSVLADYAALAIEYAQFIVELEEIHAKLREAEKLKGIAQLMHSLNHELLNLFNKMSMPMQLIQMGDISPNDKVNFENTLKTVNDAMETSIEILGYISSYRNKSKSNELKSRKIDGPIDNAINRFSKRFQEANIKIIKTIQPDLPDIQAKDTFDDIFVNILANCYFALLDKPEGERLIEIQTHLSEGKNTIQVKISDTGADMTKSTYMSDIDSPFKERGKIGGVNFGLAYLITNQHDGSLEVESYEKGGTAFVLNIPVIQ